MTQTAPKYKPCEMVLTCILTDDERRARGIEIGACVEKLEESEDEFKAVKSRFDREKKELTGKIRDLSRATRTGEELRTVNCQKVYDYANSRVYWIREDLGEVFKERPMHEDEKQFELFRPDPDAEETIGEMGERAEHLLDKIIESKENVVEFFGERLAGDGTNPHDPENETAWPESDDAPPLEQDYTASGDEEILPAESVPNLTDEQIQAELNAYDNNNESNTLRRVVALRDEWNRRNDFPPNGHGVYSEYSNIEKIVFDGDHAHVEVRVLESPVGWMYTANYTISGGSVGAGGHSSPLTTHNVEEWRCDAVIRACFQLLESCKVSPSDGNPVKKAKKLIQKFANELIDSTRAENDPKAKTIPALDAEIAKVKNEWWFNHLVPGDSHSRNIASITCDHLCDLLNGRLPEDDTRRAAEQMIEFRKRVGTWEDSQPKAAKKKKLPVLGLAPEVQA